MSSFVKGGGGGSEKVTIDGVKVKAKLELTSYSGENPYTMGQDGMTFDANTLLKEGLQIINGVNGEDLTDTVAAQTTAVTELMKMVNRKIAMNNGESIEYSYGTEELEDGVTPLDENTFYFVTE